MIAPESLDLSTLPWLPLEARSAFPRQPAIYFAIDSLDRVQYIGRTVNLAQRWHSHHRYSELQSVGGVKICYLAVDDASLLPGIEAALIGFFKPPLNGARVEKPGYPVLPKDYRSKPGEYGETKKQKQFLMTPSASEMLDSLVSEYNTTRSDLLERVVRGLSACPKEVRDQILLQIGVIDGEIEDNA